MSVILSLKIHKYSALLRSLTIRPYKDKGECVSSWVSDQYVTFQYIVMWDEIFGYVLGFLVFLGMLKLLKLLRFNKKVTELSTILYFAVKPLLGFLVSFWIIYFAFAQFGYLSFGHDLYDYRSIISTIETLMAMMLMSFNYKDLEERHRVLGPVRTQ